MLVFLDYFYTFLHLAIILSVLFGWLPESSKKLHLGLIVLVWASWIGLGLYYGLGYCPLTDWHWQVKYQLGETKLPYSFVQYAVEQAGIDIKPRYTDWATALAMGFATATSILRNEDWLGSFFSRLLQSLHR